MLIFVCVVTRVKILQEILETQKWKEEEAHHNEGRSFCFFDHQDTLEEAMDVSKRASSSSCC